MRAGATAIGADLFDRLPRYEGHLNGSSARAWRGPPEATVESDSQLLDRQKALRLAAVLHLACNVGKGSRPVEWCNSSRVALRVRAIMP